MEDMFREIAGTRADLQHADPAVRAEAAARLSHTGNRSVTGPLVPLVVALCEDRVEAVRVQAVRATGNSGDPRALAPLVGRLRDRDRQVRTAAARELANFLRVYSPYFPPALAADAVAGLEDILRRDDGRGAPEESAAAVDALGQIDDPRAAEALLAACRHPAERVASAAVGAIGSHPSTFNGPVCKVLADAWAASPPRVGAAIERHLRKYGRATLVGSWLAARRDFLDADAEPLPTGAAARLGSRRLVHAADAVAFSPDGTRLASAGGGRVDVWDGQSGRRAGGFGLRPWFPMDQVTALYWLSRPDRIAVAFGGHHPSIWDLDSGLMTDSFEVPESPLRLAVSPGGDWAAVGGVTLRVYRLVDAGPTEAAALPVRGEVTGLSVSRDGRTVAAAHRFGSGELRSGSLIFGPTSGYELFQVWDVEARRPVATHRREWGGGGFPGLGGEGREHVLFSPDHRWAAWGGKIVELRHDGEAPPRELPGEPLAFSADSQLLAVGGYGLAAAVEVETGRAVRTFPAGSSMSAAAFSPDGMLLALAGL